MQEYTIITTNFKFSLTGFIRSIENNGGYPIIRYSVIPAPATGVQFPSMIRWTELNKKPANSLAGTKSHLCKQTAEILVIGDTIHFCDILDNAYFTDEPPFINLIPSF